MADTQSSIPATGGTAASCKPGAHVQAAGAEERPAVASTDLLQGQKTVDIHHNGAVYRLQATRLGKLILTK